MDNSIFQIIDNKPRVRPEGVLIPEVKKIWTNDKNRAKWTAQGELAYIYHMVDPRSSYANLPIEIKETQIIQDFIPESKRDRWSPNDDVRTAMKKYEQMIETPAIRMLRSAKSLADKYARYFESIDLEERDEMGSLVHDPVKVMNTINKVPDMVKAINDLEDKVSKGLQGKVDKIRGNKRESTVFDYEKDD